MTETKSKNPYDALCPEHNVPAVGTIYRLGSTPITYYICPKGHDWPKQPGVNAHSSGSTKTPSALERAKSMMQAPQLGSAAMEDLLVLNFNAHATAAVMDADAKALRSEQGWLKEARERAEKAEATLKAEEGHAEYGWENAHRNARTADDALRKLKEAETDRDAWRKEYMELEVRMDKIHVRIHPKLVLGVGDTAFIYSVSAPKNGTLALDAKLQEARVEILESIIFDMKFARDNSRRDDVIDFAKTTLLEYESKLDRARAGKAPDVSNGIPKVLTATPHQLIILKQILKERIRQDKKYGSGAKLSYARWLTILASEFGEIAGDVNDIAKRAPAINMAIERNLTVEIVQVAALCLNWLEHRNEPIPHPEV